MIKNKNDLTIVAEKWLNNFLVETYSSDYDVCTMICEQNISKINHPDLKTYTNYTAFNFQPDVLGILKNKRNKEVELVFLNRSFSSISLREIGELFCYSKLANPKLSILFSFKGAASEVYLMLLKKQISDTLLNFNGENPMYLIQINPSEDMLNPDFLFPDDGDLVEKMLDTNI